MNTATFSSTMLVNITSNDPKEISDQVNKALNDVLSKLNNLSNSINTTQTQAQATYAPLPQSAAGSGAVLSYTDFRRKPVRNTSGGRIMDLLDGTVQWHKRGMVKPLCGICFRGDVDRGRLN